MMSAGKLGFIILGFVVLAVRGQDEERAVLCKGRTENLRLVTVPNNGCRTFAVCSKEDYYGVLQCPWTTFFNEEIQRCDYVGNFLCDSPPVIDPNCLDGVNPNDCSMFHRCYLGRQFDFTCNPPLVFSSVDLVCKWPSELKQKEWDRCGGRPN